jgi:hypothetical protein
MQRSLYATELTVAVLISLATLVVAETKKEYRFEVGPKAKVSIVNQFGAVSVKPSTGNYVLVNATIYSDRVEVDHAQSGSRVDVQSHSPKTPALPGVDYEVWYPLMPGKNDTASARGEAPRRWEAKAPTPR